MKLGEEYNESEDPGLISLSIVVPASVPSLRHNSEPWIPSDASKYSKFWYSYIC